MNPDFKDEIEIKIEINRAEGTIRLSDSLNQNMVGFMNTKEKAVRDALIALGWTPPA